MAFAGRTIIVPGLFSDSTLPTLPVVEDPLLTVGSLYLTDPTSPDAPWRNVASSTITTTTTNLAAAYAEKVLGTAGADLAEKNGVAVGANQYRALEATSRGGMHVIMKPDQAVSSVGWRADYPAQIKAYLEANPDHTYYACLSHRITSAQPTTLRNGFGGVTRDDSKSLFAWMSNGGDLPPSTATTNYVGSSRLGTTDDSQTGLVFRSIAARGVRSTFGTWGGTFELASAWWGGRVGQWLISGGTPSPSNILYYAYLEDLTVSGRDFATVDALAQARHNNLHEPGGRYADDTWTDPATINWVA